MCTDQWSAIVLHDGLPKADLIGFYVRFWIATGETGEGWVAPEDLVTVPPVSISRFVWCAIPQRLWHGRIVCYQVRRPRGMAVLDRILSAPMPVCAREAIT